MSKLVNHNYILSSYEKKYFEKFADKLSISRVKNVTTT